MFKPHLERIKITLAALFGIFASASIGFHLRILQNITFFNKVVFIVIASLPLTWLMYYCLSLLLAQKKRVVIVTIAILSIALTACVFSFFYHDIPAVKYHSVNIEILENVPNASLKIEKIFIDDIIDQNISPVDVRISGNARLYDQTLLLQAGSTASLNKSYAGEMHFILSPSTCPFIVNLEVDTLSKNIDLCSQISANGLRLEETDSGIVSKKWMLLQLFFRFTDLLICFMCGMGLFYLLASAINKELRSELIVGKHFSSEQLRMSFFAPALLIFVLMVFLIVWIGLTELVVFIPCALLLLLLIVRSSNIFKANHSKFIFGFIALVLSFTIFTNFGLRYTDYFGTLYKSMTGTKNLKAYSFNSLVLSVFKGINYSIYFGFRDILENRELFITQQVKETMDIDIPSISKLMINTDFRIDYSAQYTVSDKEFSCVINQPHTQWETSDNYLILGLGMSFFTGNEAAILTMYQNNLLLLPESFFTPEGICQ